MRRVLILLIGVSLIVQSCTATKGYDYGEHKKRSQEAADYYRKGGGCKKKH